MFATFSEDNDGCRDDCLKMQVSLPVPNLSQLRPHHSFSISLAQCMKFMAKTTMNTATFRDLALANAQGTLVDNPLSGYRQGSISYMSSINPTQMFIFEYLFLCVSIYICIYGLFQYQRAKRDARNAAPATSLKQPLVFA